MRLLAFFDLLGRYARITRHAWHERRACEGPKLQRHEADFLPAALALRDTPVHPAPRAAMWAIMLFSLLALLWSIWGQIDIVATAPGKIIPNGRTKVIQPMETARVAAIHVREGQKVRAGQVLIELDATQAGADTTRLSQDFLAERLTAARARAMLAAMAGNQLALGTIPEVSAIRLADEARLLEGEFQEYQARLNRLSAEIERRQAELRTTREMVAKLAQTAPMARSRAEDYKGLVQQNFVSRHGFLEKEQAAIELERDLSTQKARQEEIQATLVESTRQRESLVAETRRAILAQLHEAEARASGLGQEVVKARDRNRHMRLTAPVGGTVQQLAVHTVGGVVTPAQPLLVVVPEDHTLEVEAMLQNKDVGFVHVGQPVEIKVETFPFTKYGVIPGEVVQVSSDAIQDEKLGLYYAARVRMGSTVMRVDGRTVNLSPGMAVTAEVKTGQRQVIEYFLSPLVQYGQESLRER